MHRPFDRSLLAAALAPPALLLVLWVAPSSLLRVPLALAALVWAPGHAGLAILHPLGSPTLSGLERAALASALGLVAVPVVGLALSVAWSLTPLHVAVAYGVLVAALAGAATARGRRGGSRGALGRPSPLPTPPSTRVTLALCAGALVVAAGLFAVPFLSKPPASAALGLSGAGGLGNLTRAIPTGAALPLTLQLDAGDAAQDGRLVATLAGPANQTVLLDQPAQLAPGDHAVVPLLVPPLAAGAYELVVRWDLPSPRTLHVWFDAGLAHA